MTPPDTPVLVTGAAGLLGQLLASRLSALGWRLRLTDIAPFPGVVPPGATFQQADLEDQAAVEAIGEGCRLILHFGGISTEQSFEAILGPNFRGSFHVYEMARKQKARVVFASSIHAVGMYERTTTLNQDCNLRPDGHYGLSKAYGEMLARVYWDKHAIETVIVRIGSVLPAPKDRRMLSTWLSHDDFVALMRHAAATRRTGCLVIWGASNNSRTFWENDGRAVIGWAPRDSSDGYAEKLLDKVTNDPVAEHFQGGVFVPVSYTRDDFPPREMFARDLVENGHR
jgi:uronate dehydrogenase